MEKFLMYLFAGLIIVLGIPNMELCINYITEKTIVRGSPTDLEKNEISTDYGYKITYNLNDGILPEENKTIYGLFTADFTLNNPTKDGYEFIGWTGSNGTTPQITVTICTGSSSDLEFTANFALILETPETTLTDNIVSWNAIKNANSYSINVNGENVQATTDLNFNLLDIKEYCHAGANVVKVQACNVSENNFAGSDYSESIYFNVSQLETPAVKINNFDVSWNSVADAKEYLVSIGAYSLTTTETNINLLNHLDWLNETETSIRVKAIAFDNTLNISSQSSQTIKFVKPALNKLTLELSQNVLNWNYEANVQSYEIYVNSVKVLTVNNNSSISINEISSYFVNGNNAIYVNAVARGYNSAKSNTVSYKYQNLSQFENLTLNPISFSKTSTGYVVKYNTDLVIVSYNLSGTSTGGIVDDYLNDNSLTFEQILLKCINPKKEISMLNLNVSTLELLEFISNSYIEGQTQIELNVSGMFKFLIADQNSTTYIPNNLKIIVKYEEMFFESSFKEGSVVSLNDCYSSNCFEFANSKALSGGKMEKYVSCGIVINNDLYPSQFTYDYTSSSGKGYYYIYSISYTSAVTEAELNNYLKNCKFYLNDDYYFKIKGNFSDFYKFLFNEVCRLRNSESSTTEAFDWSYERITYTIDVSNYFDVYSNDGTKVTFNYTLTVDCITARTI